MSDHTTRLDNQTPRASRSNAGAHSFPEHLKETIFLDYNDEIYISAKGVELLFVLEAKIPVEARVLLPNHIDDEYPVIDLDDPLLLAE